MIDGDLRRLFRAHLPKPAWLWTPIESGGTTSGIPDSHWLNTEHGRAGWLEYKSTSGWSVEIRPHQVAWLTQHSYHGVNCKIAVRAWGAGSAAGTGDALWLLQGSAAAQLAASGLPRTPRGPFGGPSGDAGVLGVWYGPPREWPWDEIARLLLS